MFNVLTNFKEILVEELYYHNVKLLIPSITQNSSNKCMKWENWLAVTGR